LLTSAGSLAFGDACHDGEVRRAPLAALTAAALVVLGASSCTGTSGAVDLAAADRGSVTEVVDASAAVTAKAVATVTAPSSGTVASLSVTAGQSVAAGQEIAVIDSPGARQQLQEASAALAAANAGGGGGGGLRTGDLSTAQKKTDDAAAAAFAAARSAAAAISDPTVRAALLAQIDAAAQQYASLSATARSLVSSVQRGIASVSSAVSALGAAQRAQAQSAYDLAKSTVDALTLRTPIAGVVQLGGAASTPATGSLSNLLSAAGAGGAAGVGGAASSTASGSTPTGPGVDTAVGVGAPVGAGTAIATIVDVSALGLLADVDETDVLLVAPGVRAQVELDAAPGATYDATVGSVDILPTTSARGGVAYRVRLSLGTGRYSDGRGAPTPRPGMSAVTHLMVREAHDAVTVPAAAVVRVDGHDAVWVSRDGKAVRVPVTLGVQGPDRVQVLTGLAPGDRVVVRGADRVRAGQSLP
jgi:multidrug efflux pump subunit AcrA (membrane-fusion protein)